nr:hypothetical protein CFP56_60740 [Quercus suber]
MLVVWMATMFNTKSRRHSRISSSCQGSVLASSTQSSSIHWSLTGFWRCLIRSRITGSARSLQIFRCLRTSRVRYGPAIGCSAAGTIRINAPALKTATAYRRELSRNAGLRPSTVGVRETYTSECTRVDRWTLTKLLSSKHTICSSTDDPHTRGIRFDGRPLVRGRRPLVLHGQHQLVVDICRKLRQSSSQLATHHIDVRTSIGVVDGGSEIHSDGPFLSNTRLVGSIRIKDMVWLAKEVVHLVGWKDDDRVTDELRQDEGLLVLGELPSLSTPARKRASDCSFIPTHDCDLQYFPCGENRGEMKTALITYAASNTPATRTRCGVVKVISFSILAVATVRWRVCGGQDRPVLQALFLYRSSLDLPRSHRSLVRSRYLPRSPFFSTSSHADRYRVLPSCTVLCGTTWGQRGFARSGKAHVRASETER